MRRSEPSKDPFEQEIINEYQHNVFRFGSFSEDENENEIIEKAELQEIEEDDANEALSLLSDTMDIFNSLHDYYYNGDRSLNCFPIVLLDQMYSFQHPTMHEELENLKNIRLTELMIVHDYKEFFGVSDKYEYIDYLQTHFKETNYDLIERLITYVKTSNGKSQLPENLFSNKEILTLIRIGLVYEKRITYDTSEKYLLYPNKNNFCLSLFHWKKKVLSSINSSINHEILRSVCFSFFILVLIDFFTLNRNK